MWLWDTSVTHLLSGFEPDLSWQRNLTPLPRGNEDGQQTSRYVTDVLPVTCQRSGRMVRLRSHLGEHCCRSRPTTTQIYFNHVVVQCPLRCRRELINHTLPPIVSAPNFVMRSRKTSLTYRLLRRHQNYIIVCIYFCGLFLKTRKVTHNENENLFEHKTPCPGFTSKCLSSAQTAFRSVG